MELAPRLNLITGDNGLGKSFLLDVAWWALTRRWPHDLNPRLTSGYAARPTDPRREASIRFRLQSKHTGVEYESVYVPRDEAWAGRPGRPWNPGLVIYAHADGGFSVWDPARNYWKKRGNIDVQDRLPGYVFSAKEVWDGLEVEVEGRLTVVSNGLLRDWPTWIRERGDTARRLEEVLRTLSPPDDEIALGPLTRLSVDDVRDVPTLRTRYSDAVPVVHASSGVRRVIGLAYMLLWSWNEHVLAAERLGEESTRQVILLVDEIESHLHPRWQRTVLRSVLHVANVLHAQAQVQLITATHSPLVLASAEPTFDPELDAWLDLDAEHVGGEERVVLRRRDFFPRGDVSNWLTSEAFDLKSARSEEAERALEAARELLRRPTPPSLEEVMRVDAELHRAALSDIDPFWVRWGSYVEGIRAAA
ncbi:MAG TPA: ATP-binding protein [Longimicrobium sp.]|nr:ATP-binding protein [Longimicrobium sp.]